MKPKFIKITEEITKDIVADYSIFKIEIDSVEKFGELCMNRLNSLYSSSEIEKMRLEVPKNYIEEPVSSIELLTRSLAFLTEDFIPKTKELRLVLKKDLNEEEIEFFNQNKARYLGRLDAEMQRRREIILDSINLSEERKKQKMVELDLVNKRSRIIPNFSRFHKDEREWYVNMVDVAKKTKGVSSEFLPEYLNLMKTRSKISFGNSGNFLQRFYGIKVNSVDKFRILRQRLVELLFIE